MSDLDDLLKSIPLADIAAQLGVSQDVASAAVNQTVPTLLAGLQAQDTTEAPSDLAQAADNGDGQQIVSSLFGEKTDDVAAAAAAPLSSGVTNDLVKQLLPILAPIVISFVMKKLSGGTAAQPQQQAPAGNGDLLGSILGNMLGGGNTAGGAGSAAGNVLGGILGGLLNRK
ncbi:hypothetical protein TPAU25S_03523 [Tsukamurella paurometabola]|uniref:DUF937 domain-containing protein n=1 Tax=Tsukamurella paurometabola (strain ATCC 8368 / DSM 20162 / CCUG 35730 / CIP 100753 / JCM 10117 / KCTC 9821 / NBRC 16120 / NCIMB 702349 / NCTC 13040) TaxID=521096 RepID=D5UPZ5_TSUPD|nr:DUF937 domain-containing protein [Tsukamurella paurometabola]ADG76763.1 Protein of unknown function DUF2302 [Tsukamurella paurometabola DSM 20162]SUP41524.1 Bacterial protein of uncharacterised function (DUF937) [Tsukamurella paurometabola]